MTDPSNFTILDTKRLTNDRWLNLYSTTFSNGGVEGKWTFASRERGPNGEPLHKTNAVVIVAILDNSRVVIAKEYRVPLQGFEYHFPAGLVEPGQTIEEAAAKELEEEAGCILDEVTQVSPVLISSSGLSDESSRLVFCTCHKGDGQKLEVHEQIEPLFPNASELEVMLNDPTIVWAAKSWPLLMFYVLPMLKGSS